MTNDGKSGVIPRLRFPEFRGDAAWNSHALGSDGTFVRGLTYSASDVQDAGLLVLRSTNIQGGRIVLDDVVYVRKPCPRELQLQSGDVVICMSNGSKALVGKSANYESTWASPVTIGAFCSLFRSSNRFAKLAFQSEKYADHVALAIAGGNINNLKNSDLESFEFEFPPSPFEQNKIADCLTALDDVIAAQAQKVKVLKAHKQGLRQQLFPSEGETVPSVRFPGFHGKHSWHTQKISSLLGKVSKPVTVSPELRYREIGIRSHGKGIFHKHAVTGETIGTKRVFHVVKNALVVNIVFAWEQAIATTSDAEEGMIASHRFPMFVARPGKCDVKYVKEFFLTKRGKHLLGVASPGGAGRNKTLGQTEFENLEIALPDSVEEQSHIAGFIALLDGRIAAESKKLDALMTHKKGLMRQIFPSSGAQH